MKIRNIIIFGIILLISAGCVPWGKHHVITSSNTKLEKYKKVNFSNLYEKNSSYKDLDTGISAILDGILTSSKNKTSLSKKESKLLEQYVKQNKLFCYKGFDQRWMNQLQWSLDLLEKNENNRIASAVNKKMQVLFSVFRCR